MPVEVTPPDAQPVSGWRQALDALNKLRVMTNATKAQIVVSLNAILMVLISFHVLLTQTQVASIGIAANAILGLFVGTTYTQSAMRADGN